MVPFLHSLLRRKLIERGLLCIHWDSHADLCVPSANTKESGVRSWLSPRSLYYDVLGDSEAAISEFLIPLMYNQDIGSVVWIKSQMASASIEDGLYNCVVGDRKEKRDGKNIPAINLPIPYFLDEGSASLEASLRHARPIRFQVVSGSEGLLNDENLCSVRKLSTPLQSLSSPSSSAPNVAVKAKWILDICLDFFSVISPFHGAILRSLEADLSIWQHSKVSGEGTVASQDTGTSDVPMTAEEGMDMIRDTYSRLSFRTDPRREGDDGGRGRERGREEGTGLRDRGQALEVLRCLLVGENGEGNGVSFTEFARLFPRGERGPGSAARRFYYGLLLPVLGARTRGLLVQAGLCVLLPHHVASAEELQRSLASLKQALVALTVEMGPPSCVTIARSVDEDAARKSYNDPPPKKRQKVSRSAEATEDEDGSFEGDEDGFTPSQQVDSIQSGVLRVLRALSEPDGAWGEEGVHLQEHHLYADAAGGDDGGDRDVYERCYGLFLNPKARVALSK